MTDLSLSLVDEARPVPCPERFNMARYVMQAGRETPEKVALTVVGPGGEVMETWRYGELDRAIRGTAQGLIARGLGRGDRVALRIGNVSDFPILFFGVIAAGGIAVPTSSQLTEGEFHRICQDMTPRFVAVAEALVLDGPPSGADILPEGSWPDLRANPAGEIADTGANDPAYLVYTSGTSGRPKGVLHAHRAAWARRMMWTDWYGLRSDDVMLHAGAFNWTYTLGTGLTDPWAAGASSVILAGPSTAEAWPALAKAHGATLFAAVPGVFRQILRQPGDLSLAFGSLRHGLAAGERLAPSLAEAWQRQTGKPLFEALGMSEVSTFISSGPRTPRLDGFCGRPQSGRRVAILGPDGPVQIGTDGDLAISRGDQGLMLSYWNQPGAFDEACRGDWFITGDRAVMNAEGYITHLGRADDMITALGYRVSPAEVEDVLIAHPAVSEAAVVEERVRADLTLIAAHLVIEGDWPGDEALAAHCAAHLAPYKCPRLWHRSEQLPRTANGKLQRRHLAPERDG